MKRSLLTFSLIFMLAGMGFAQHTGVDRTTDKPIDKTTDRQQVIEMMQDTTSQDIVLEQIAQNPEMREKALKKMTDAVDADTSTLRQEMQTLLENPEVRKRMESHVQFLQAMLNGDEGNRTSDTGMDRTNDRMNQDQNQNQERTDQDNDLYLVRDRDMTQDRRSGLNQDTTLNDRNMATGQHQDTTQNDHHMTTGQDQYQTGQDQYRNGQQYGTYFQDQDSLMDDSDLVNLHMIYMELMQSQTDSDSDEDQRFRRDYRERDTSDQDNK